MSVHYAFNGFPGEETVLLAVFSEKWTPYQVSAVQQVEGTWWPCAPWGAGHGRAAFHAPEIEGLTPGLYRAKVEFPGCVGTLWDGATAIRSWGYGTKLADLTPIDLEITAQEAKDGIVVTFGYAGQTSQALFKSLGNCSVTDMRQTVPVTVTGTSYRLAMASQDKLMTPCLLGNIVVPDGEEPSAYIEQAIKKEFNLS